MIEIKVINHVLLPIAISWLESMASLGVKYQTFSAPHYGNYVRFEYLLIANGIEGGKTTEVVLELV